MLVVVDNAVVLFSKEVMNLSLLRCQFAKCMVCLQCLQKSFAKDMRSRLAWKLYSYASNF